MFKLKRKKEMREGKVLLEFDTERTEGTNK